MDKFNLSWGLLVDVVIALIILFKLLQGRKQGVVKKLGGLVSLVCAIFGGKLAQDLFTESISERWLQPGIVKLLDKAKDSLGLSDMLEDLGNILSNVNLPEFLKIDVVEDAAQKITQSGLSAVTAASDVIAERVAAWILFLVGALVVYLVVSLIFNGVLDPVIRHLPLVQDLNGILGAILGAAVGILIAGLLLWLAYKLVPALSKEAGAIFSAASIDKTFLAKLYFKYLPSVFA